MVTPYKIKMDAAKMDAVMEMFERTYLHFVDLGHEEMKERERGTLAFYALRDMCRDIIKDMNDLGNDMEQLAEAFEGKATICKVNTDEESNLAAKFGIRSIPTLVFMKDGKVVDTIVGAVSEAVVSDKLNSML